jgi:ElaB/YqjD/DUF883 family membrane-anchored ribosome-binding protein
MAYHMMESTTGTVAARTRQVMDAAQDAAERAGEYVSGRVVYISDRAQDLARAARDRAQDYTGQSEVWASDAREYARAHPLRMLGILIGVGYILGKLMMRGPFPRAPR